MRKALVPVIAVNAHHRNLGGAAGGVVLHTNASQVVMSIFTAMGWFVP
jgi:hypothetical protein